MSIESAGDCGVAYLQKSDLEALLSTDSVERNWERFNARYPNSLLVSLSAMGWSHDARQGLTYVAFPGWYRAYFVVTKRDGEWRMTEKWPFGSVESPTDRRGRSLVSSLLEGKGQPKSGRVVGAVG